MITTVLRWNGFEKVIEADEALHPARIEMVLGEHIYERVWGETSHFIAMWAFEFVKVDEEGRRIYEATSDPFESIVEAALAPASPPETVV